MLAPTLQTTAPVWPIPGDAPDLTTIVQDQAETIAAQEALLHAYQGVLNTAQLPPPTTASGTATGTTALTLASVTNGPLLNGATITGTGVPTSPAPTILGQQSGTPGGNGVYTTSAALTLTNVALTFTPGGGPSPWPPFSDAPDLNAIQQSQTTVLRQQSALLQGYQDLLNVSNTPPPASGP